MDFAALEKLRTNVIELRSAHVPTMLTYVNTKQNGFYHQKSEKDKTSLASSATCYNSLVMANALSDFLKETGSSFKPVELLKQIYTKERSSGLLPNNPFSTAFICELMQQIIQTDSSYADLDHAEKKPIEDALESKLKILLTLIFEREDYSKANSGKDEPILSSIVVEPGAVGIRPYPASAYLTQLVFRVLVAADYKNTIGDERWKALTKSVSDWGRKEIQNQISRIKNNDRHGDPLALAYATILVASARDVDLQTPNDRDFFRLALEVFFESQNSDGSWPISGVLFHYPSVGNAYCFEYELLAQLISTKSLWDELLRHTDKLSASVDFLFRQAYDLDPGRPGRQLAWASGHHLQLEGPESWSTASVYQFLAALDRLVAEGVRRHVFQEFKTAYLAPVDFDLEQQDPDPEKALGDRWRIEIDRQLDSTLDSKAENVVEGSLTKTMFARFAKPIAVHSTSVKKGKSLPKTCPMSALLYGPPGTSKTEWAKMLAKFLGWPLLSVDPSYIVAEGMDRVYAMTNRLFSMLSIAEEIVVLLDEFDEMGKDRTRSDNVLSRFFTTAMLPKLIEINKSRRIVFLLATNYLSEFDSAFTRDGRFDMRVQIMQPNIGAKLARAKECHGLRTAGDPESMRRFAQLPDAEKLAQFWAACAANQGNETIEEWLKSIVVGTLTAFQVIDDLTFGEFRNWLSSSEFTDESSIKSSLEKWATGSTLRKSQSNEMFEQRFGDAVQFYEAILGDLRMDHPHRQEIRDYLKTNSVNIFGKIEANNWFERCEKEKSEIRIPA